MKFLAEIPVEKVFLRPDTYTIRHEVFEVTPIRWLRWPAGGRNRWNYQADIIPPPQILKECLYGGKTYRASVKRKGLNDKWPIPNFMGKSVIEIPQESHPA
jgi:hypothetical protein